MLEELLRTAREDAHIRAVLLEGSRTDGAVQPDLLQDFDIAYIVQKTASFRRDRSWIDRFGQQLFMQYPDEGPWRSGAVLWLAHAVFRRLAAGPARDDACLCAGA